MKAFVGFITKEGEHVIAGGRIYPVRESVDLSGIGSNCRAILFFDTSSSDRDFVVRDIITNPLPSQVFSAINL